MSGYDRLESIIRSRVGRRRPIIVGTVVDVARWSAVGPSWVGVRAGGDLVQAWWSDAPQPTVGDPVRVVRARSTAGSWWLALPVVRVAGCAGVVYVSGRRASTTEHDVLRFDLATGHWSVASAHPAGSSSQARRPLRAWAGTRLLTWAMAEDAATGGLLYYSDDLGVTWVPTALGGVVSLSRQSLGGAGLAALDDGVVTVTRDNGATWEASDTVPDGGPLVVAMNANGDNVPFSVEFAVATTAGVYTGGADVNPFNPAEVHIGGGPYTPVPVAVPALFAGYAVPFSYRPEDEGALYTEAGGWLNLYPSGTALTEDHAFDSGPPPSYPSSPSPTIPGGGDALARDGFIVTPWPTGGLATRTAVIGRPYAAALSQGSEVGARDVQRVVPGDDPVNGYCWFVALDEDAVGSTRYVTQFDPDAATLPATSPSWVDVTGSQVVDTGYDYVASRDGVTALYLRSSLEAYAA